MEIKKTIYNIYYICSDIYRSMKIGIECGWEIFKINLIENKNKRIIEKRKVL